MSKIRLNTEYRNKFFNKIKDVFFKEDTQEGEAFLQSREDFKNGIGKVFETAKTVVQRNNPIEDVETCRRLKRKYGQPLDVVAKDKCFFMAHSEDVDEDNEPKKLIIILILVCMVLYLVRNMVVMMTQKVLLMLTIAKNF
jgi:hypothetical protein